MITKDEIIKALHYSKISDVQFDLNGVCNAKCWFCPIKYEPQVNRQNISVDNMKIILDKFANARNNLFAQNFRNVYTASFNEIVLYPYFEDMLRELQQRNMETLVLTNGVGLTKNISDLIVKYKSAVTGIHFNIPAIEPNEWSKQTGFNIKLHDRLIENIQYVVDNVQTHFNGGKISLVLNGYENRNKYENGGFNENLKNFPDIGDNVLDKQYKLFVETFPSIKIFKNSYLNDRDSLLEKNEIVSFTKRVNNINKNKYVVDCKHSANGNLKGRIYGWLHVNTFGDVFLCCNDYNQTTKFGNILDKSIEDVWFSQKHVDVIYNELTKGMCSVCVSGRLNK